MDLCIKRTAFFLFPQHHPFLCRVCNWGVLAIIQCAVLKLVIMFISLTMTMKMRETYMGIPCLADSHMMIKGGLFWR